MTRDTTSPADLTSALPSTATIGTELSYDAAHAEEGNAGFACTLLGAPPTPVGDRIYTSFSPDEVKHIRISGRGPGASFSRGENGWQASAPWSDRMDPRAAVGIIHFALGMRVEDLAAMQDIDPNQAGLGKDSVNIRLEAADHT